MNTINEPYLVLDTETTGLGNMDEIIELAIIDHMGKVLFNELMKPTREIHFEAVRIHGISNEMVAKKPNFNWWYGDIKKILEGQTVCIYNAEFDIRLLKQTAVAHNREGRFNCRAVCVMEKYRQHMGIKKYTRAKYGLQQASKNFKIKQQDAHRALDDCLSTLAVIKAMNKEVENANKTQHELF
jgi:DNA polymerase III subunit epsilon